MNLEADKFLEDLSGRYSRLYFEAVQDFFVAEILNQPKRRDDARAKLADTIAQTMGCGEVLGARIVLRHAAGLWHDKGDRFAKEPTQQVLPSVTLSEALEDMVQRVPVTVRAAAERTAASIAQLYSEGKVIAFARAAEETVTEEAQRFIARAYAKGMAEGEAGKRLAMTVSAIREETEAWSESYARMAFRTNVNTAVTAGRFRQAQDADIRAILPAFRFDTMEDVDVRPNHAAADGIVLAVDDPQWSRIAPPLGYNCRCSVVMVSVVELEALGRLNPDGSVKPAHVPPGAGPDPGFRHSGRPDLMVAP